MWLSILMLGITLSLLFFLRVELLPITGLYLYAILLLWRIYKKQVVLLDIIVFCVYLAVSVGYYILGYKNMVTYMGTIFYASLSIFCILGGIFKVPFTVTNVKKISKEDLAYHRLLSVVMGILYIPSLLASIILFPKPSYIYLPLLLLLAAIPLSIYLTKGVMFIIDLYRERKDRMLSRPLVERYFGNSQGFYWIGSEFIGKEVITESDERLFLDTLKKGYINIYKKSKLKLHGDYNTFFSRIADEYEKWKDSSSSFVVIERTSGKGVGTIRLVVDKERLPLEEYTPFTLENYRRLNIRVAEAGRLSIVGVPDVKKRIVFTMLYSMLATKILESDIELLFADALEAVVPIYEKSGFVVFPEPYQDLEFEAKAYICCLNPALILAQKGSFYDYLKNQSSWGKLLVNLYKLRIRRKHLFDKNNNRIWKKSDFLTLLTYKKHKNGG